MIGLGPYARSFYFPVLEELTRDGRIEVLAIVDLVVQGDVLHDYLGGRELRPPLVLLDGPADAGLSVSDRERLGEVASGAWGCIIATEPRAHMAYAVWALELGLRVLLEKPVTARDFTAPGSDPADLRRDYEQIAELAVVRDRVVVVQAQRRVHPAYLAIREWAADLVGEYGVPVTHLALSHADGSWNMPWEFDSRENHPHRYGYGKLLHSGYHFIDALSWFGEVNDLAEHPPDSFEFSTIAVDPRDVDAQLGRSSYERLFGSSYVDRAVGRAELPAGLGETDVTLVGAWRQADRIVSTTVLTLLQTAFSRRSSLSLPLDTYKGNGRVRQESLSLQIGPLGAVHAQSLESGDGDDEEFVVTFLRNSDLVGGETSRVERFRPPAGLRSLSDASRRELIGDFLDERVDRSGIALHRRSIDLLVASLRSVARRRHPGGAERITWDQPEGRREMR